MVSNSGVKNGRGGILLALSLGVLFAIAPSAVAEDELSSRNLGRTCGMQTSGTLIIDGGVENRDQESMGVILIPGEPKNEDLPYAKDYLHPWLDKFGLNDDDLTLLHPHGVSPWELNMMDAIETNTEAFVEPITATDALFIQGGREWRLVDAYKYTRTHEEMWNLLERGGMIAGTAAGATAQGYFMPRSDPNYPDDLIADRRFHQYGFGFLPGVTVYVQDENRNGSEDIYKILNSVDENLLGISLPENTAIVVKENYFNVVGDNANSETSVRIYNCEGLVECNETNAVHQTLEVGDWYDLCQRKIVSEEGVRTFMKNGKGDGIKKFSLPYYFKTDHRLAAPDFRCSGRPCRWTSSLIQTTEKGLGNSTSRMMSLGLSGMIFSDGNLNVTDYFKLSYRTYSSDGSANAWILLFTGIGGIEEISRTIDFEVLTGSVIQILIEAETSVPIDSEYLVEDLILISNEPETMEPSSSPTSYPSATPTSSPTKEPSSEPTSTPSAAPSSYPSVIFASEWPVSASDSSNLSSINIILDENPVSLLSYFRCLGGSCQWESNTISLVTERIIQEKILYPFDPDPVELRLSALITSAGNLEDNDFLRLSYRTGMNENFTNSEWESLLSYTGNIEKGTKSAFFSVPPGSSLQFRVDGETSELYDEMYIIQDLNIAEGGPTTAPSTSPTLRPTTAPSASPTLRLSTNPSGGPTEQPTIHKTLPPVKHTRSPSASPSVSPSSLMLRTSTAGEIENDESNKALVVGLVLGLFACIGLVGIYLIINSRRKKQKVVVNNNDDGDANNLKKKPSMFSLASSVDPNDANNNFWNGFHPYFSWINPIGNSRSRQEGESERSSRSSDDSDDSTGVFSGDTRNLHDRSFVSSLGIISEDESYNSIFNSHENGSGSLDEIEVVSIETGDHTEKHGVGGNSNRSDNNNKNTKKSRKAYVDTDDESNGSLYKFVRYMSFRRK